LLAQELRKKGASRRKVRSTKEVSPQRKGEGGKGTRNRRRNWGFVQMVYAPPTTWPKQKKEDEKRGKGVRAGKVFLS